MIQQMGDRKGPHRRFSGGIFRFEKKLFRVFNVFISPHFLFYSSGAKKLQPCIRCETGNGIRRESSRQSAQTLRPTSGQTQEQDGALNPDNLV